MGTIIPHMGGSGGEGSLGRVATVDCSLGRVHTLPVVQMSEMMKI